MKGGLFIHEIGCPLPLRRYVRRLVGIEAPLPRRYKSAIAPTGYSYLLFVLEGSLKATGSAGTLINLEGPQLMLGGVLDRQSIQIDYFGPFKEVIIEFTATGLYELFGIEGEQLAGAGRPIASFQEQTGGRLSLLNDACCARRDAALSIAEAATLIRDELGRLVGSARQSPRAVSQAVEALEQSHGLDRISEMACNAGISATHLRRRFTRIVGLSPKSFARVIMFGRAMEQLVGECDDSLTDLAVANGYFDQAHFINTVKRITGQSPRRYRQSNELFPDELYRRVPSGTDRAA